MDEKNYIDSFTIFSFNSAITDLNSWRQVLGDTVLGNILWSMDYVFASHPLQFKIPFHYESTNARKHVKIMQQR